MTIEHPVLRLGLAGFEPASHNRLAQVLAKAAPGSITWEIAPLALADAYLVEGASARMEGDVLRVAGPGNSDAGIRLHLAHPERPCAFALPVAGLPLPAGAVTFEPQSLSQVGAALDRFEAWLSPLASQLCLASHIVDHQAALQGGTYHVVGHDRLLAVVDMHGDTAVLPGAAAADFENSEWRRRENPATMPEHFARASLSELMWNYAVRTHRDLLPRHYRTGLLYFRRPPRLATPMLQDSHVLLMRELTVAPATFVSLGHRTGLGPEQLARDLAALYFVGAITSNPKRATRIHRHPRLDESSQGSLLPSSVDSALPDDGKPPADLTIPVPLRKH